MKAVRKMKDFSIESILADTFIFEQTGSYEGTFRYDLDNCEDIREEKDGKLSKMDTKINVDATLVMSEKNHVEYSGEKSGINSRKCCNGSTERGVCVMTNLKKTQEFGEEDNCDVDLTKNSELDVEENLEMNYRKKSREFYINFERYNKYETWKNSLWVVESEHDRCINKLHSSLFDNIKDTSNIIDLKSNFAIIHGEQSIKDYEKTSKFFTDEKDESNDMKVAGAAGRIAEECKTNSKVNDRQKEDFVRHLKRDKRRKFDREKRKSKKDQSEILSDSKTKDSSENCNSKLLKNKNFKNNLSRKSEISKDKIKNLEAMENIKQLEWLQFTRYKPPKIPRKPTMGKHKRKPSLHPRIPFSTSQLDFLEEKFRSSAYLSKNDVLDISVALKLPPNRIKIWFQNRRARERREFHANI